MRCSCREGSCGDESSEGEPYTLGKEEATSGVDGRVGASGWAERIGGV